MQFAVGACSFVIKKCRKRFIHAPNYPRDHRYIKQDRLSRYLDHYLQPTVPGEKNVLPPSRTFIDLPCPAARKFWIKLRTLVASLIDEKVLGEMTLYVRILKYQQRDLPFAHCDFFDSTVQNSTSSAISSWFHHFGWNTFHCKSVSLSDRA